MMILFLNDGNSFESYDPTATLVEFDVRDGLAPLLFCQTLKKLEYTQPQATRMGGHYQEILEDVRKLGIHSNIVRQGRKSEFDKIAQKYTEYKLISGNY